MFLQDHTERTAQICLFNLIDIDSIIADLSVCDVIETVDQICDCCLSGPGRTYKSNLLPRLRIQRNIMKHRLLRHISKVHIKHPDISGKFCVSHRSHPDADVSMPMFRVSLHIL